MQATFFLAPIREDVSIDVRPIEGYNDAHVVKISKGEASLSIHSDRNMLQVLRKTIDAFLQNKGTGTRFNVHKYEEPVEYGTAMGEEAQALHLPSLIDALAMFTEREYSGTVADFVDEVWNPNVGQPS